MRGRSGYRRFVTVAALCVGAASMVGVAGGSPAGAATIPGYWVLAADGGVTGFGAAAACQTSVSGDRAVDISAFPSGTGYRVLTEARVLEFACGANPPTPDEVALAGLVPAGERPVSLSPLPDGSGYWVFTDTGRAVPVGAAAHHGDMAAVPLNQPIIDSVATPTGLGYWMVAADGGVFSFGDAAFYGSTGDIQLNQPVVAMAAFPGGAGYWLVAADGGVFAFGTAPFYGSMGAVPLNRPMRGVAASPTGDGYLMVAADGGVFAFGDVPFFGSLGGAPPSADVVSVSPMPTPADLVISTPEDELGLVNRLIMSTVHGDFRPPRPITLTNRGGAPLTVTGITVGGPQASEFRLAGGTPTSFTLEAGASATLPIVFDPDGSPPPVRNEAFVVVSSDDPDQPVATVTVRALNAVAYEGSGEPSLEDIVWTTGFVVDLGAFGPGSNAALQGDEIAVEAFTVTDPSRPVTLLPIARYASRSASPAGAAGWTPDGTSVQHEVHTFAGGTDISGGENQRLRPVPTGPTAFTPTGVFTIYSMDSYVDDALSPRGDHTMRVYPVRDPATGVVLPSTWLVANDLGTAPSTVNLDYQDIVYLVRNVTPAR